MLAELVDLDMTGGIAWEHQAALASETWQNRSSTCDFAAAPWWCESCGAISNLARYNNACEKIRRRCVASCAVAEGPATQVVVRRVECSTNRCAPVRCLSASSQVVRAGQQRGNELSAPLPISRSATPRVPRPRATCMAASHRAAHAPSDRRCELAGARKPRCLPHSPRRRPALPRRDGAAAQDHRRGEGASQQRILTGVFELLADSRDQELV